LSGGFFRKLIIRGRCTVMGGIAIDVVVILGSTGKQGYVYMIAKV
jgi:hypothetical protein